MANDKLVALANDILSDVATIQDWLHGDAALKDIQPKLKAIVQSAVSIKNEANKED